MKLGKLKARSQIIITGIALALAAFALEWLDYKNMVRSLSTQTYILILVSAFTLLGIWFGQRLTKTPKNDIFVINEKAVKALGLTRREQAVLKHLADGKSNKQIARDLGIAPNTVKTHMANLFAKLEASGRMDAVNTARDLRILP